MIDKNKILSAVKIAGIALVILLVIFTAVFIKKKSEIPKVQYNYFSNEPEDWVDDNIFSENGDDVLINTKKATRDYGQFDTNRLELLYLGNRLTFFYHGAYKGNLFDTIYFDPSLYDNISEMTETQRNEYFKKNAYIRITPEIDPNDGVMEAYILGKMEEDKYVFYVFVDEDWKSGIKFANILWTNDFKSGEVHIEPFDFSVSEKGIYISRVEGPEWFKDRKNGGIYVGEIDSEIIKVKKMSEVNRTFIYMN